MSSAKHSDAVQRLIRISLAEQRLELLEGGELVRTFAVSTAENGAGERQDSGCTPRGWHEVRARIGAGAPLGAVFVGRRRTGEIHSAELAARHPNRDWILTRILWLRGLERGCNRGRGVDSMRRYIYLHGCPDSEPMGVPRSHGCVRMRNAEIVELFEWARPGTRVWIQEAPFTADSPRVPVLKA